MADEVMRMPGAVTPHGPHPAARVAPSTSPAGVHRKCGACGTIPCAQCAEGEARGEADGQSASAPLSRRASAPSASTTPPVTPAIAANLEALPGSGQPLGAAASAFFEPRFGFDFASVRVHTDARAAETARQLQARAFTVGQDIAFSAGEYEPGSPRGMHLLAHELAHVVQQSSMVSGKGSAIRRAPADGAAGPGATAPEPVPGGLIVESAVEPGPAQMRKDDFLAALRPAVERAVDETFPGEDARAQIDPYVENAFASAEARTSQEVERGIREQVPDASGARAATDYIPMIEARVRQAGRAVPSAAAPAGSPVARKARGTGVPRPVGPQAIRTELGGGQPLGPRVRSRMEAGFEMSFSHVRLHTEPAAARLSECLEARAFTVGEHIAFGAGEYRPGTTAGDTLLAHELAHVAQQAGASAPSGSAGDLALERDADASAETVIGRLWKGIERRWSGERDERPRLRSGLRLQRQAVNYRFQNVSGFDVCIYCICERQPGIPEKQPFDPDRTKPPKERCPPGFAVEWGPSSCFGVRSIKSKTPLSADPCPKSTNVCI